VEEHTQKQKRMKKRMGRKKRKCYGRGRGGGRRR